MKIRNGFVSNSSSSSFTCDVCGETQSGMDLGISEAGMFECENGHTVCETHQREVPTLPVEEIRKKLVAKIESQTYYYDTRPREKAVELDTIANYDESEVEDAYSDLISSDNRPTEECPVCMFEKLDKGLVLQMLIKKSGISEKELLDNLKRQFGTFVEFKKYVES